MTLDPTASASPTPLVSVIIPAYNCSRYVREAIDSVLAQTFTDFELVVVNDTSTDDTPAVLAEYERQGKIRVVTHEKNRGLSAARNSGIRVARGRYVTFLDADDVWRPEKLAWQMRILRDHPDLMLLGNEEQNFFDGEPYRLPPMPEQPRPRPVQWEALLFSRCGLSPSNAIMRKECFEAVGGFDETLRSAEDRDQWLRIVRRFPAMVDPAVVNAYRLHHNNMSANPQRMKDNKQLVLEKAFREAPAPWTLRARAYAQLYMDIAITCQEAGRRWGAVAHIGKSLLAWPLPIGGPVLAGRFLIRWRWLARALLGPRAAA